MRANTTTSIALASSVDLSEFRRTAGQRLKQTNLQTIDRIIELMRELDELVTAGENPFGKYLSENGRSDPAGAVFDFRDRWAGRMHEREFVRHSIERFGCQLNWTCKNGEAGFWHKNKDILPFAQEFSILSHIEEKWVRALTDCGLFLKNFHGNRISACGDVNWCRKCNWNFRIEPKQRSYSPDTWLRGGHWYGYTISYETNRAHARAVGRVATDEDFHHDNPDSIIFRENFRPPNWNLWGFPELDRVTPEFVRRFSPDIDDPCCRLTKQYASRRFLKACQHSISSLVHGRLFDGAEQNCEVALGFMPFRVRWHVHGLACSLLHDDPQNIADRIQEEVDTRLRELARSRRNHPWPLNQRLYSNVLVAKFVEYEQLLKWIAYVFKTVNFWEPVYNLYLQSENLLRDGRLHPSVERLLREEIGFMRTWIDEVFTCKALTVVKNEKMPHLSRSYVWRCLRFGEGRQFIRFETQKEKRRRRTRAREQKCRREEKQLQRQRARQLEEREGL